MGNGTGTDPDIAYSSSMSIQPNASLTNIGFAAPVATIFGIVLNIGFFVWMNKARKCI